MGVGTGAEANVSAESTARAAGIRGGEGNDSIRNEGTLAVKAISIAGAGSIAVGVADSDDQENQAENPSASAASEASEASSVKAELRQKQPQPRPVSPAGRAMTASSTSLPST